MLLGIDRLYKGTYGRINRSVMRAYELPRAEHSGISFKYVHSGLEHYSTDSETFHVRSGEILVIRDSTSYTGNSEKSNLAQGVCIEINSELFEISKKDVFGETDRIQEDINFEAYKFIDQKNFLTPAFEAILKVSYLEPIQYQEQMVRIIQGLINTEACFSEQLENINVLKSSTKKELFRRLLDAQAFIHDNLHNQVTLDTIADNAYISKFHLQRLFKSFFGLSPSAYLERLKMEAAKDLIRSKTITISEIALRLGYNDTSHFSRRFKNYYGVPPSKLRKN